MKRIQPVWRRGEPLRLTYLVHGVAPELRLVVGDVTVVASVGKGSVEFVIPAERFEEVPDGVRVALQVHGPAGWESVGAGFLVKEGQ